MLLEFISEGNQRIYSTLKTRCYSVKIELTEWPTTSARMAKVNFCAYIGIYEGSFYTSHTKSITVFQKDQRSLANSKVDFPSKSEAGKYPTSPKIIKFSLNSIESALYPIIRYCSNRSLFFDQEKYTEEKFGRFAM